MEPGECPGWASVGLVGHISGECLDWASVGLVGCISGEHLNLLFLLWWDSTGYEGKVIRTLGHDARLPSLGSLVLAFWRGEQRKHGFHM